MTFLPLKQGDKLQNLKKKKKKNVSIPRMDEKKLLTR